MFLGCHTLEQVVAGALVGALLGWAWFDFTHRLLAPRFPAFVRTPLARWLMLRDWSHVPSALWAEYDAAMAKRE